MTKLIKKLTLQDHLIDVSQKEIIEYWNQISLDDDYSRIDSTETVESVFLHLLGHQNSDELKFINGGWTINAKAGFIKTAIGYATMAGVFTLIGTTGSIALMVLPSVLPFLFEIEKIELNKKEQYILAKLLLRDEVKTQMHNINQLYELLPNEIKSDLNILDFIDFLEKLDLAGYKDTYTEKVYRLSENARFKLSFK